MDAVVKADLYELVDALPDEALDSAALFLRRVLMGHVEPEQMWVWTQEWQEQLRSSLADLAARRSFRFDTNEEFLASL